MFELLFRYWVEHIALRLAGLGDCACMTHGWVRSITKVDMGGHHDRTFLVTRSKVSLSGVDGWTLVCWFDIPKTKRVGLVGMLTFFSSGVVPWSAPMILFDRGHAHDSVSLARTNKTESTVEIGQDQNSQVLTVSLPVGFRCFSFWKQKEVLVEVL